jgi:hypothetical protein
MLSSSPKHHRASVLAELALGTAIFITSELCKFVGRSFVSPKFPVRSIFIL